MGAMKEKQNATPKAKSELAQKIAAVRTLAPQNIDRDSLRAIIGDVHLRTLGEVAAAFNVTRNTVQGSWRQNEIPMPGETGDFPAVDILAWLLERDSGRSNRRTAFNAYADSDDRTELGQIELEQARADLAIKQARLERINGDFVSVELVGSDFSAALGIIRDEIMSIGRSLMPFCPVGQAIEFRERADRQCERILNSAADRLEQAICKHSTKQREDDQ
jgi:hypothetical protein